MRRKRLVVETLYKYDGDGRIACLTHHFGQWNYPENSVGLEETYGIIEVLLHIVAVLFLVQEPNRQPPH